MDEETRTFEQEIKAKANVFRKLGDDGETGSRYRKAWAERLIDPILGAVKGQSSVEMIFTEDKIEFGQQANYQVRPDVTPSTNAYTGAGSILTSYEVAGHGPSPRQFVESGELFVPPKYFETPVSFGRYHAQNANFNYQQTVEEELREGILDQKEATGWAQIQAVAGHGSFPAAQLVSISAGAAGTGKFSRQLFDEMLEATLTIGMHDSLKSPKFYLFCSVTSFKEFNAWGHETEFDISTPGQLAETDKSDIAQAEIMGYTGKYRGFTFKALRRLGTGDVVASHDYVYMIVTDPTSNKLLAKPTWPAPNGEKIEIIDDPSAPFSRNEIAMKARWSENYVVHDARCLVVGDITRA